MYLECNLMGMSSNVYFPSDVSNGHPMARKKAFLISLCMKMKATLVLEVVVHLFVNLRNQFSELILISIFLFNCMIFLYA